MKLLKKVSTLLLPLLCIKLLNTMSMSESNVKHINGIWFASFPMSLIISNPNHNFPFFQGNLKRRFLYIFWSRKIRNKPSIRSIHDKVSPRISKGWSRHARILSSNDLSWSGGYGFWDPILDFWLCQVQTTPSCKALLEIVVGLNRKGMANFIIFTRNVTIIYPSSNQVVQGYCLIPPVRHLHILLLQLHSPLLYLFA